MNIDKEKTAKYFNLSSIHNLRFILRLTEEIRESMINGTFETYKNEFLKDYYRNKKQQLKNQINHKATKY